MALRTKNVALADAYDANVDARNAARSGGKSFKKLTKRDAAGNVSQWGVKIPSTGFGYWMFQAMTASNDTILMNSAGTKTYFDKPGAVQALQHDPAVVFKTGQQGQGEAAPVHAAPPASVFTQAAPQALASSRTRRM